MREPTIKTESLYLYEAEQSDLTGLSSLCFNPEVTKYMDYIKRSDTAEVMEWIESMIEGNSKRPRESINLSIYSKSDNQFVGWIGFGEPPNGHKDELDFGFALHPDHWGKGYGTEALNALVTFSFEEFPYVTTIICQCNIENKGSKRVMLKSGMKFHSAVTESDGELIDRYVVSRSEFIR